MPHSQNIIRYFDLFTIVFIMKTSVKCLLLQKVINLKLRSLYSSTCVCMQIELQYSCCTRKTAAKQFVSSIYDFVNLLNDT